MFESGKAYYKVKQCVLLEQGCLNQPITVHLVPERYNNNYYYFIQLPWKAPCFATLCRPHVLYYCNSHPFLPTACNQNNRGQWLKRSYCFALACHHTSIFQELCFEFLFFKGLLLMLRESTKADLQSTWMPSDG